MKHSSIRSKILHSSVQTYYQSTAWFKTMWNGSTLLPISRAVFQRKDSLDFPAIRRMAESVWTMRWVYFSSVNMARPLRVGVLSLAPLSEGSVKNEVNFVHEVCNYRLNFIMDPHASHAESAELACASAWVVPRSKDSTTIRNLSRGNLHSALIKPARLLKKAGGFEHLVVYTYSPHFRFVWCFSSFCGCHLWTKRPVAPNYEAPWAKSETGRFNHLQSSHQNSKGSSVTTSYEVPLFRVMDRIN